MDKWAATREIAEDTLRREAPVAASSSNFMPLHGAILISNPRKSQMASARRNPNDHRRVNKIARILTKEAYGSNDPYGYIDHNAAKLVAEWTSAASKWGEGAKGQYRGKFARKPSAELKGMSKAQRKKFYAGLPKGDPDIRRAAKQAVIDVFVQMDLTGRPGYSDRFHTTAAGRMKWGKKRTLGPARRYKTKRGHVTRQPVIVDRVTSRGYNAGRVGRKAGLAYWGGPADAEASVRARKNPGAKRMGSRDIWGAAAGGSHNYKTGKPKGSGTLITGGFKPQYPGKPIVRTPAERRRSAKKAAKNNPWLKFVKSHKGSGLSMKELSVMYKGGARANPRHPKKHYRKKHGIAQDNYGALALDNYGALALDNYGALALDNPVPFVGGVAADAGKLVLVGLAGALGHAFVADKVEDLLPKIPVIGEKLLDLSVPDAIPVIGGMELDNTVSGTIAGIALIAISQIAGRKLGQPMLSTYGSALGTGIIMAGPILDFAGGTSAGGDDEGAEDADIAGLALDNYGAFYEDDLSGLALENTGTFGDAYGDGMAYQLGAIAEEGDDYGQASLGDAYYSGADFDLGEGQALVNGRGAFHRRFGAPTRRVQRMGGTRGGASHLASKPGHRWGWLIKMIGWANVQKLAAMPPKQRVIVIKKLRSNALDTFSQLQVQAQEQVLSAPELAPLGQTGPDGVSGVFGAYGATVFGGAGL